MLVVLIIFYFSGHLLSVQGCTYGELRLVGGHSSTEGRVEICIDNVWGTVCDDHWDDDDAKVVCRQLGYSTKGAKSYSRAHFGQGSGSIFLDDVFCLGSESSLLQCYHRPIGNHDCTHIEDASVSCSILSPGAIAGVIISSFVVIISIAVCIVICAIIIIKKRRAKIQSQRHLQGVSDTAPSRIVPPTSTLSTTYPPPPPYSTPVPAPPNSMPPTQMTTNQAIPAAGTTVPQGAVPVIFHPGNQVVSYNVPSAQPMYYYYPYAPQYIPLTEPMTQPVVAQSVPQQSQTIAPTDHELPQVQSITNEDEAPIIPPSSSTEEEPKEFAGDDEADDAPLLNA